MVYEYYYIKGEDLLRVSHSGDFISAYQGANNTIVQTAIDDGGTIEGPEVIE